MCEPPFGCDRVPPQYAEAWEALLAQCPPAVDLYRWEQAIYAAADLFGRWGAELARLGWTPDDLLDAPREDRLGGLAWWLKGDSVTAIGPGRAFTPGGRVFERGRR